MGSKIISETAINIFMELRFQEISSANEFIGCFQQSRIQNLQIHLTNFYYDLYFSFQTEKKNCFGPIRNLFSF